MMNSFEADSTKLETAAVLVTPEQIWERVCALLKRGAANRKDDFHTTVLATIGLDHSPQLRTVVFRKFEAGSRNLICHVDRRSPKVLEIAKNNCVSWLFYHVEEKLQLRLDGRASVHTIDQLAAAQWENTPLFSRRCYCGDAPGTVKDEASSGLPEFLIDREPTAEETERLGRKNFAVLVSTISAVDVYELNVKGHRRSRLTWDESGELKSQWLTP